ncbi:MAG: hypothetical protein EA376_00090 [Phycisphaeraceae bacterium]|nr:MAG: hypothetical protein EA376_00090 [Phycisphaeraceae bacterium]
MRKTTHWFVTADDRCAKLYSLRDVRGGRRRVSEHESVRSDWEDYHERGRPNPLGRGPSANAAQGFAARGHQDQEERNRFARDVKAWIESRMKEREINRISVFAAPRMLGALRAEFGDDPPGVSLHEGEFTPLHAHQLAEHPAIAEAIA